MKRPIGSSASAQVCQLSTANTDRPRTLSFIFASPRSELLESVACALSNRNIVSPIRLRDPALPGLVSDLARMSSLGMRAVVILDAEAGLAAQLHYRAHALGLEAPLVALIGEDRGQLHHSISLPFTFDKFRALLSRLGGGWLVG